MRRHTAAAATITGGLLVVACGSSSTASPAAGSGSAPCVPGTITASGSTALQPLAQAAAAAYHAGCPAATITVSGGGSSAGLANVAAGAADIGNSDVPVSNARQVDPHTVTDHQVAIVVFAVAVNDQTGVSNLTVEQVRDLFSGRVTNWSQVGGRNLPVSLIERKPGSGTRLSFDRIIMRDRQESPTPASTQDSTQLVLQQLTSSAGAVSYLNVASITRGGGVSAVSLSGVSPGADGVRDGRYPFFSHEHMYTRAGAGGLAASFIDFILSAPFQSGRVTGLGYLAVSTTTNQSAAD